MSQRRWLQRNAAALMSGHLAGCTSWHLETLSSADVVAGKQPNAMRVEYGEGQHEVLYGPRVRGDSLVGRRDWSDKQSERAVALADVKPIATATDSDTCGRTRAKASLAACGACPPPPAPPPGTHAESFG